MPRTGTVQKLSSNPFRDPDAKPSWAHLTRLGGDRVAILFEALRKRVGSIPGLIEDLHFTGPEEGWAPRYCLGEETVAYVHIRPGILEAVLYPGDGGGARQESAAGTREAPVTTRSDARGKERVRVQLASRAAASAFARRMALACRRLRAFAR